jgi:hypothetical protein
MVKKNVQTHVKLLVAKVVYKIITHIYKYVLTNFLLLFKEREISLMKKLHKLIKEPCGLWKLFYFIYLN